jgi:hypothetical protein
MPRFFRLARAAFVPSFLLLVVAASSSSVRAEELCRPLPGGARECAAGIPSARMAAVYASQRMDQWCWAASIAMVFSFYGHPVSQERIVRETFGRVVDLPAMGGATITRALNREWVDDDGKTFRVASEVTDAGAYEGAVDRDVVARELRAGRPLIVGTRGHAMVVGGMDFVVSPVGRVMAVESVTVRDPWPGVGRRQLRPDEMRPVYVAAIHVSD